MAQIRQSAHRDHSAPISEVGNEAEEAEIDEGEDEQKSTISNINSMDPVQWSALKRNIADDNKRKDDIRSKLLKQ